MARLSFFFLFLHYTAEEQMQIFFNFFLVFSKSGMRIKSGVLAVRVAECDPDWLGGFTHSRYLWPNSCRGGAKTISNGANCIAGLWVCGEERRRLTRRHLVAHCEHCVIITSLSVSPPSPRLQPRDLSLHQCAWRLQVCSDGADVPCANACCVAPHVVNVSRLGGKKSHLNPLRRKLINVAAHLCERKTSQPVQFSVSSDFMGLFLIRNWFNWLAFFFFILIRFHTSCGATWSACDLFQNPGTWPAVSSACSSSQMLTVKIAGKLICARACVFAPTCAFCVCLVPFEQLRDLERSLFTSIENHRNSFPCDLVLFLSLEADVCPTHSLIQSRAVVFETAVSSMTLTCVCVCDLFLQFYISSHEKCVFVCWSWAG